MRLPILFIPKSWKSRPPRWWLALLWSTSGYWQDGRAGRYLRHGIEGALSVLIVLLLVSSLEPHTRTSVPTVVWHSSASASPTLTDRGDAIVAAHLFGQAPTLTSMSVVAASSITVDGIVYSTQADDSQVVLTLNTKTDIYKVGASLPDGEKVVAIDPDDVQLVANGASRRLAISKYGSADSEGPAAYAALLHGTGISTPPTNSASAALLDGNSETATAPFVPVPSPLPVLNFAATPRAPPVRIPATATPLEQLQALRQQLIHPH